MEEQLWRQNMGTLPPDSCRPYLDSNAWEVREKFSDKGNLGSSSLYIVLTDNTPSSFKSSPDASRSIFLLFDEKDSTYSFPKIEAHAYNKDNWRRKVCDEIDYCLEGHSDLNPREIQLFQLLPGDIANIPQSMPFLQPVAMCGLESNVHAVRSDAENELFYANVTINRLYKLIKRDQEGDTKFKDDMTRYLAVACLDYLSRYDSWKVDDCRGVILNAISGLVSIKQMMDFGLESHSLIHKKDWLYYYPKLNLFFFFNGTQPSMFRLAPGVFSEEMIDIIKKESLRIPKPKTTEKESLYRWAMDYCKKHNLLTQDRDCEDVSWGLRYSYRKEKGKSETSEDRKKKLSFKSIEEVKTYLENYKRAKFVLNQPEWIPEYNPKVRKWVISSTGGWLDVDMRLYYIRAFLFENGYVSLDFLTPQLDKKYMNNTRRITERVDIGNMDISLITWLVYHGPFFDRVCDGYLDSIAASGVYLRIVKRAEQLKSERDAN